MKRFKRTNDEATMRFDRTVQSKLRRKMLHCLEKFISKHCMAKHPTHIIENGNNTYVKTSIPHCDESIDDRSLSGKEDEEEALEFVKNFQNLSSIMPNVHNHPEDVNTDENIQRTNTRNQPMLHEAVRMLARSMSVYYLSRMRLYSSTGKSSVPFECLTVESDDFPLVDIINGIRHRKIAFDQFSEGAGRTAIDILDALLHTLSRLGLSQKEESMTGIPKRQHTRDIGTHDTEIHKNAKNEDDIFVEICADTITLDFLFEKSLKEVFKPCSKKCKLHVGTLCQVMGLHYVQIFFDQIHDLSHKSEKFKKFRMSFYRNSMQSTTYDRSLVFSPALMMANSPIMLIEQKVAEDPTRVVWINDRVTDECVYFILCSKVSRRVTVVFRGSVTIKDWIQNVRTDRHRRTNPIEEDYPGRLDYIETLHGHSEYLLTKRRDNYRSKYDEIADKVYEYGMEMGVDFEICVTGHSLGGALATLFAFHASTDPRFEKQCPIRLFTFNSSYAGRVSFAKAFQHQEYTGKIMHMRFTSKIDIVPYLKRLFDAQDFAHTGVNVQVDEPLKCHYVKDLSFWTSFWVNLKCFIITQLLWFVLHPVSAIKSHSVIYNIFHLMNSIKQLNGESSPLASMTLEEVYETFVH